MQGGGGTPHPSDTPKEEGSGGGEERKHCIHPPHPQGHDCPLPCPQGGCGEGQGDPWGHGGGGDDNTRDDGGEGAMYRGRGRCGGAALAPGGLALFAVRVLGVGVPGQPLLVEGDDDLGTLEVRLFRQHQVGLVCVLPGGVGTPKKNQRRGSGKVQKVAVTRPPSRPRDTQGGLTTSSGT